jgi:ABC-type cobalamin transport system ATPase subunit
MRELQGLVDAADVTELLVAVDRLVAGRAWDDLTDLARRCNDAVEYGRQLWPVAMHVDYRLALEAPPAYAGGVLRPGAARFALGPLLDRSPLALSDGEKRRVALAAALAHQPDLLLLDEPTAGQDGPAREALAALFAALRAEGVAVLLATHDLEFAARHCGRWLVLAGGELLADAAPGDVLGDPATLARAGLAPTPVARLAAALGVPYPGEDCALAPAPLDAARAGGVLR